VLDTFVSIRVMPGAAWSDAVATISPDPAGSPGRGNLSHGSSTPGGLGPKEIADRAFAEGPQTIWARGSGLDLTTRGMGCVGSVSLLKK